MAAYTSIDDPEAYFKAVKYSSNGTAIGSGGLTVTGFDFTPTWLQMKQRDADESNGTYDSVRGVTKSLRTNGPDEEDTRTEGITAFNSNGFTCGSDSRINPGGTHPMIAYGWLESATSGFDIVAYTGNGTDDTDISHNLSAVPKLIIVKNRSAADSWQVYHGANTSSPETDYLVLNTTAATVDAADRWSDEAPTSSVFTLGDGDEVNTNTESYIAYVFAEKQGYSKFGSYEGNGNADGTFVYTGFRPAFVMTKSIDSTSDWHIFDDKRDGYNVDNDALEANTGDTETTTDMIDLLSNGFKFRIATDPNVAETYIYAAFAEAPFVNSNGVPCNAR